MATEGLIPDRTVYAYEYAIKHLFLKDGPWRWTWWIAADGPWGCSRQWTCHSCQCWGWAARKWHNLQECECCLWFLGPVVRNHDSEKSLCVYIDICIYPLSVLCSMKWWPLICWSCPCRERRPHCSAIKEPLRLGLSLTKEQLPKPKHNHHA